MKDFHTHNLEAIDAIISLPKEIVFGTQAFEPRAEALYSAGIHPWWVEEMGASEELFDAVFENLGRLLSHPQVVMLGECGYDALKGGDLVLQEIVFEWQVALAENHRLPVTIHCVRAFHLLLAAKKRLNPTTQWTVHGFRGNAALARQLLDAGFNLSFGKYYNPEALAATPEDRRFFETD